MKIGDLTGKGMYTSNVYFVLGSWNRIPDKNTLVDVGTDPELVKRINKFATGFGKKRVEQVILTHNHSDHTGLLPDIINSFKPEVYAFWSHLPGVDHVIKDGELVRLGDRYFEVVHTPGHSQDSICLYCEEEKTLFVGDTNVVINSAEGTYGNDFVEALKRLCRKDVQSIYFGHGLPLLKNCNDQLAKTLSNVRKARDRVRVTG